MSQWTVLLPLYLVALLVGATLAAAVARYGARWLADVPRRHSSHRRPVPRGGGLGIPVALLVSLAGAASGASGDARETWIGLAAAIALVAAIGLLDDLFDLPVWPRLGAHVLAALLAALTLAAVPDPAPPGALAIALAALGIAWSINLHNFMDGANGLLGVHALLVLGALATLSLQADVAAPALLAGVTAAAVVGFLPFNLPRARVFLGDCGSGTLGLVIACAIVLADRLDSLPLAAGLCLASGFVIDASATLAQRLVRGRRWYTRHREHLYQWSIRSGASHLAVAAGYALWTLCMALPAALLARRSEPGTAWAVCGGLHVAGVGLWFAGKRWLLRRATRSCPE